MEQHVHKALQIADRVYVLQRGEIKLEGAADDIRGRAQEVQELYFAPEVAPAGAAVASGAVGPAPGGAGS